MEFDTISYIFTKESSKTVVKTEINIALANESRENLSGRSQDTLGTLLGLVNSYNFLQIQLIFVKKI